MWGLEKNRIIGKEGEFVRKNNGFCFGYAAVELSTEHPVPDVQKENGNVGL